MNSFIKKIIDMDNTIFYTIILIYLVLVVFILLIVPPVTAFNITTDETTETSIIWNLSANTNNITNIALDGIILEGYISNPKQLVQNNLYAGETHLIIVETDDGNTSTGEAQTEIKSVTENEKLAGNINLYFLFFVALTCLIVGIFIPYIALASVAICLIGVLAAFNHSLVMGVIFFACSIASIWIAITNLGD